MCGRYYVDDGVMEDIRRIVDGAELALKDIRRVADGAEREQWRDEGTGGFSWDDWTGDIYPSRPAPVLLGAEDKAAAEGKEAWFCIHFARGCCAKGSACEYYHRIPIPADLKNIKLDRDCFGRERFGEHRKDMGGSRHA